VLEALILERYNLSGVVNNEDGGRIVGGEFSGFDPKLLKFFFIAACQKQQSRLVQQQ